MTMNILKTYVPKQAPTIIKYRDYRKFNDQMFWQELQRNFSNIDDKLNSENLETNFKNTLYKHAPLKTKTVRSNNAPYMNKAPSKAIMNRSRLKKQI